jgi:O-antigen/teichoic acid export membrane protein
MTVTREHLKTWLLRISLTGGAQAAIQALGLVGGILVIRTLPATEYAYYTIAYAVLGTLGVLCDGGISTGVTALSAKVWQNPAAMGRIYKEGMHLRRRFAVAGLTVALPIMGVLLHRQGANLGQILAIAGSLIPTFFSTLTGQIREISLRLHQRLQELQVTQLTTAGARLGLIATILKTLPSAPVAILASGLPQLWANRRLQKKAAPLIDLNQPPDPVIRRELWTYIGKILPGSIYYALSGQITVLLISVFGNVDTIAQVGASGRLAMLLNVVATVFGLIVTPRFSKLPNDTRRLLSYYYWALGSISLACVSLILPFFLYPHFIDLLLGAKYSDIHAVVLINFVSSSFALISGAGYALTSYRGHVINPSLAIAANISFQVLAAFTNELNTAIGITIYGLEVNAFQVCIFLAYGWIVFRSKTRHVKK